MSYSTTTRSTNTFPSLIHGVCSRDDLKAHEFHNSIRSAAQVMVNIESVSVHQKPQFQKVGTVENAKNKQTERLVQFTTLFNVLLCELKIYTHYKSVDCNTLQKNWDGRLFITVYHHFFF